MVDFSVAYWHTTASRVQHDVKKRQWLESVGSKPVAKAPEPVAEVGNAGEASQPQPEQSSHAAAMERMMRTSPNLTVQQMNILMNSTAGNAMANPPAPAAAIAVESHRANAFR